MNTTDYFNRAKITPLASIRSGGSIHVIGVSGVAMAPMAVALSEAGYQVSGSDKEFYEPMGGILARSRVRLCRGYARENIVGRPDLVVIGNAVSRGHEEVSVVEERQLSYTIFPQLLHDLVIARKHSIVVTGTHGKTTTSALTVTALERLGREPGYFIGGMVEELPASFKQGCGDVSVVEGDEYDSAFFAKVPKFNFYSPSTLIITSIEFDHADIYPDLDSIKREFDSLVLSLPSAACVVCCLDDENVGDLLTSWRQEAKCKFVTYGISKMADFHISHTEQRGKGQKVIVESGSGEKFSFSLKLPGLFNAKNALASLLAMDAYGVAREDAARALSEFKGVRRRQEVRFDGKVTVVEDFAHHPSAVRETLSGIRAWFPGRRIWAVFEPRSNTSRRKVFQHDYVKAFSLADQSILCQVKARSIDAGLELIDVAELASDIAGEGMSCCALPDADSILAHLVSHIREQDVVVVMSNGSFDGLVSKLVAKVGAI